MRGLLLFLFAVRSIWDLVTSLLGIIGLFGVTDWRVEYIPIYITALVGSSLILGLSINTEEIWSGSTKGNKIFIPLHIAAIIFDAYTSFLGTAQNVLLKDSRIAFITIGFGEVWEMTTFEQKIALLFVTVLITMSPIAFSKFRK
ncbi:MAG: hypothetical protein O4808_17275 [Trichodesmium sp. St17_bin3_1_1]|nr:hypothetical protein [Trichodesmium sp. St17_bin3_1_1]